MDNNRIVCRQGIEALTNDWWECNGPKNIGYCNDNQLVICAS